jgi:exportin-7
MLSLILLIEAEYTSIQTQIAASLPPEQQQRLATCFQKLMAGMRPASTLAAHTTEHE